MRKDEIKLGIKARDRITGFEGIIVHHTKFITGCDHVGLQPVGDKDDPNPDCGNFDYRQVEVIDNTQITIDDTDEDDERGGPELYKVCKNTF